MKTLLATLMFLLGVSAWSADVVVTNMAGLPPVDASAQPNDLFMFYDVDNPSYRTRKLTVQQLGDTLLNLDIISQGVAVAPGANTGVSTNKVGWTTVYTVSSSGGGVATNAIATTNGTGTDTTLINPTLTNALPIRADTFGGDSDIGFGREYLMKFYIKLQSARTNFTKIGLAGDSTIAGSSVANTAYYPSIFMSNKLQSASIYPVAALNYGVSGVNTEYFITNTSSYGLSNVVAQNLDLLIVRYGANGLSDVTNEIAQTERLFQTIRTDLGYSYTNLPVVWISPEMMNDSPNDRDNETATALLKGVQQLCREYQVAFFNANRLTMDVTNMFNGGDHPYGGDRLVHHTDPAKMLAWGIITDWLVPPSVQQGPVRAIGSFYTAIATEPPGRYTAPWYIFRATTGFPINGAVETRRQQDGVWIQENYSYGAPSDRIWRTGSASGWNEWVNSKAIYNVSGITEQVWATNPPSFFSTNELWHGRADSTKAWPIEGAFISFWQKDNQALQLNYSYAGTNILAFRHNIYLTNWTPWAFVYDNQVEDYKFNVYQPAASELPTAFTNKITLFRAEPSDGYPVNGAGYVFHQADGVWWMEVIDYTNESSWRRSGGASGWNAWVWTGRSVYSFASTVYIASASDAPSAFTNAPVTISRVTNSSAGFPTENGTMLVIRDGDGVAEQSVWDWQGSNKWERVGVGTTNWTPWIQVRGATNNVTKLVFSGDGSSMVSATDGSALTNLLRSSTVSAGSGVTVTPTKNADGSTNYAVSATGGGGGQPASPVLTNLSNGSFGTNALTSIATNATAFNLSFADGVGTPFVRMEAIHAALTINPTNIVDGREITLTIHNPTASTHAVTITTNGWTGAIQQLYAPNRSGNVFYVTNGAVQEISFKSDNGVMLPVGGLFQ